jgi:hypothetical protein
MKHLLSICCFFMFAMSAISIVVGLEWGKAGRLNHTAGLRDPAFYDLGDAFIAVGNALEVIGASGFLLSISFLVLHRTLILYEKRLHRFEGEVERSRQ